MKYYIEIFLENLGDFMSGVLNIKMWMSGLLKFLICFIPVINLFLIDRRDPYGFELTIWSLLVTFVLTPMSIYYYYFIYGV